MSVTAVEIMSNTLEFIMAKNSSLKQHKYEFIPNHYLLYIKLHNSQYLVVFLI